MNELKLNAGKFNYDTSPFLLTVALRRTPVEEIEQMRTKDCPGGIKTASCE
jgi:hypothetical protein